jgi:predicted HicB family RNase H-like nuclease
MKVAALELSYKGYLGSLEASIEDGCLHGRILFIDDLITYEGDTVPAIQIAFQQAVDRYFAHCERTGKQPNRPYSGTFNVRIGPELHSRAAKAAHLKKVKLNEYVKQAIQWAIETNGVVTHEHHHQHDVNVTVERAGTPMTVVAGMGPPSWKNPNVKLN